MQSEMRVPCSSCGETVSSTAASCPRCREPVLVDAWVDRVPPSPRGIYAAARDLETLGPEVDFLSVKRTLDGGGGLLLSRIGGALGSAVLETLESHGASGTLQPSAPIDLGERRPAASRRRGLIAAAASVVAVAGWWIVAESGDDVAKDSPIPVTSTTAGEAAGARSGSGSPALAGSAGDLLSSREIGELAAASTASLRCGSSVGSGFFIESDLLVTNSHVLCGETSPIEVVMADGRELTGWAERREEWLDLATVRVAGAGAPALLLGDATILSQGDEVHFYGSPRGLDFTLARALVSHAGRSVHGLTYVQLDGNVNPGNSGGPLLDGRGRVVGIVSMMVGESSGLGLALPVNYLYEGPAGFAKASVRVDTEAWTRLTSAAVDADQEAAAEVRDGLEAAALAGVFVSREGEVQAVVMRQTWQEPQRESFDFVIERGTSLVCQSSGETGEWTEIAAVDSELLDDRTRAWLRRHDLQFEVWAAPLRLDWSSCGPPHRSIGATATLLYADPSAAQAVIAHLPRRGF